MKIHPLHSFLEKLHQFVVRVLHFAVDNQSGTFTLLELYHLYAFLLEQMNFQSEIVKERSLLVNAWFKQWFPNSNYFTSKFPSKSRRQV